MTEPKPNFNTPEFREIAEKLRTDGWAIQYMYSGHLTAFKQWLKQEYKIDATGVDGGFAIWALDNYWKPPQTAHKTYDAWGNFGAAHEANPKATPLSVGFTKR
ncbi:hypothetical protein [Agrobacterium tumefaciens]|uniref:hypothetical protein n=1 Tax=Agrobacterium tumefaciens TaxID=358 RepID=UPI003BA1B5F2